MRDLDEVIEKIKEYKDIEKEALSLGYSGDLLCACQKLKVMGLNWGDKLNIPYHFRITNEYYLTSSATHYKPSREKYYIVWDNGNIGRLQFIHIDYYCYVNEEWENFLSEMRSYNPVDYDPLNCSIVYDIENGKRVIADYKAICERTRKLMEIKVKKAKIEKMEKELEKLKELTCDNEK